MQSLILATRKSPLAVAQADLAARFLTENHGIASCELLKLTTTGDEKLHWSLEKEGGKGLFTKELEDALLRGDAHFAVHSAKDMPTDLPSGLTLAGYLPREVAHDVLIIKEGVFDPEIIATSSPRRRSQIKKRFPKASFVEIRGNVQTRFRKMQEGLADATIMAGAGLKRLGIESYEGFQFIPLKISEMVPAVGQGAVALECTESFLSSYKQGTFDEETSFNVTAERLFLSALGGGCQVAYAAHFDGNQLHIFHEKTGYLSGISIPKIDHLALKDHINTLVRDLKLL